MKKQLRNLLGVTLLAVMAVTIPSCSSDDDSVDTSINDANELRGEITESKTLTSDNVYTLTGELIVKNGAVLTIEAGTRIEASGISYIAVEQGGKIYVNGTATNPVVMTSPTQAPGSWGGLVICGKAPINKGTTAQAEVSGLTYGGTDVNDNSGSIKYLRIEYSGFAYNSEKEFNGLSMFGVGKGTTIEYVQVHEGSDDGFEWFGGTVDTSHLISTSNEDDQFDWTEGWNGNNENWYSKKGLGRGNRGIEADSNANDRSATPISSPTITNLTLIGLGAADEGSENQAMKLREGTHGIFDNVYIKSFARGLDVQHDETIAAVGTTLKLTNVKFDADVTEKAKYTNTDGSAATPTGLFTESESAEGAGNNGGVPTWAQGWTIGLE